MAKKSLAKCLSSMNVPASHSQQQQPHKHRQHNHQVHQQYVGDGDQPQPYQPTGEKLDEFSYTNTQLNKSAYVTAAHNS